MDIRRFNPLSLFHRQNTTGSTKATSSAPVKTEWKDPEILHDQPDANEVWVDAATASATTKANLAKETEALLKLTPQQREQYSKLSSSLSSSAADARLSLQNLLLNGKLVDKKDSQGNTLLQNLSTLSEQPMQADIAKQRGDLLGQVIKEMDDPTAIAQKGKNTCGATTVQIILANRNPAEYVRILDGLTSPSGKTALSNGKSLSRLPGTETDDGSNRTIGTRLMAPAFMQYADGAFKYDNSSDLTDYKVMTQPGLLEPEIIKLAQGVNGQNYSDMMVGPTQSASSVLAKVAKAASPENPVIASLTYGGDDLMSNGHYVQITGIKDGQVTYINPWGQVERMDQSQFQQHIISAAIPNKSTGIVDTAKNVVNTADMLVDMGAQKAKESGIMDKVSGFFKSLKFW